MLLCCFTAPAQRKVPGDTAKGNRIVILDSDMGEYIQSDVNSVHKLLGSVKLLHGSDTLYCDSAFFYTEKNSVEAFGDVAILQQDGTEATADYMRYAGNNKTVFMRGNGMNEVQLTDPEQNSLWSKEIDYNLTTKVGRYKRGGQLQTGSTVLNSNTGEYNLRSKEARFKGDVVVDDPDYHTVSVDLGYNTENKVARFFGPSIVTNDKSILQTTSGTYDSKNRAAHFFERSSITNDAQYIEADTLHYDRNIGDGIAIGNVIAIDTGLRFTLFCGYAKYNEIRKTLLAYHQPLMRKKNGDDSLYIRYDTFFSAPDPSYHKVMSAQDSLLQTVSEIRSAIDTDSIPPGSAATTDSITALQGTKDSLPAAPTPTPQPLTTDEELFKKENSLADIKQKMDAFVYKKPKDSSAIADKQQNTKSPPDTITLSSKAKIEAANDSTSIVVTEKQQANNAATLYYNNTPQQADSSAPRYFMGYPNVLIYTDSLQGKCDSIRYSEVDSMMRMYKKPLLWPQNGQLKGDVIYMQMDSSKLKEIHVPKNAIMINRSGPEKAQMFDQIQGNYIRAYLRNNKIDSLIAEPNAASIYFITDDDKAYVGSSEAQSERIEVYFVNEDIDHIYYRRDVTQKTTPMKDVIPVELRLSRFLWQDEERPKSLDEFLKGASLPHAPEMIGAPQEQ